MSFQPGVAARRRAGYGPRRRNLFLAEPMGKGRTAALPTAGVAKLCPCGRAASTGSQWQFPPLPGAKPKATLETAAKQVHLAETPFSREIYDPFAWFPQQKYSVRTPICVSIAARAPKMMRLRTPHADLISLHHVEPAVVKAGCCVLRKATIHFLSRIGLHPARTLAV